MAAVTPAGSLSAEDFLATEIKALEASGEGSEVILLTMATDRANRDTSYKKFMRDLASSNPHEQRHVIDTYIDKLHARQEEIEDFHPYGPINVKLTEIAREYETRLLRERLINAESSRQAVKSIFQHQIDTGLFPSETAIERDWVPDEVIYMEEAGALPPLRKPVVAAQNVASVEDLDIAGIVVDHLPPEKSQGTAIPAWSARLPSTDQMIQDALKIERAVRTLNGAALQKLLDTEIVPMQRVFLNELYQRQKQSGVLTAEAVVRDNPELKMHIDFLTTQIDRAKTKLSQPAEVVKRTPPTNLANIPTLTDRPIKQVPAPTLAAAPIPTFEKPKPFAGLTKWFSEAAGKVRDKVENMTLAGFAKTATAAVGTVGLATALTLGTGNKQDTPDAPTRTATPTTLTTSSGTVTPAPEILNTRMATETVTPAAIAPAAPAATIAAEPAPAAAAPVLAAPAKTRSVSETFVKRASPATEMAVAEPREALKVQFNDGSSVTSNMPRSTWANICAKGADICRNIVSFDKT